MKYDRIQETFRYITPGLYFLALVLLINYEGISECADIKETISTFSAIIILLLPFVGFVVGYFIECVMALIERGLYWIGISRPSRKLLHGKSEMYHFSDEVRTAILQGVEVNDNKTANRYQQVAKQVVGDNSIVTRHYNQSIMARHIFGAQLFVSVYYLAFAGGWSLWNLVISAIVVGLLGYFWYHQTCVYMKYLIAEYGKIIIASQKTSKVDDNEQG